MNKEECCGCGVCVAKCPQNAITMIYDEEGFAYPHIEEHSCISCGICNEVCRFTKDRENRKYIIESLNPNREIYIGRHYKKDIVKSSRSGGIFTALSDLVLDRGGLVYGCILNDELSLEHIGTDKREIRNIMRGSKYSQSNISADMYTQIENVLTAGREVLFSGTSCQVAALKEYLQKDYDNLLTIDILCHGVESPLVLREYIKVWEKSQRAKCIGIDFREKSDHGWAAHTERLYFKDDDGKDFFVDSEIYKNIFYGHYSLRPSCYVCPYKTQEHPGDITLGDCWGIEKVDEHYSDDNGCSIIFINSNTGNCYFESIIGELDVKKNNMCNELFQPSLSYPFNVDNNERFVFWGRFLYGNRKLVMEQYGHGKFEKDYFEMESRTNVAHGSLDTFTPRELKRIFFARESTTLEEMPEEQWYRVAEKIKKESNDLVNALYKWADGYQNNHNIRKIFGASDDFKRSIDSRVMFDTLDNDFYKIGEKRAKSILEEESKKLPNEKIEIWRNEISTQFLNNEIKSPQEIIDKLKTYLFEVHHPVQESSVTIGESLGFSLSELLK